MATGKAEVEVKLGVPVHRIWSAAKKVEVLIPKLIPDVFTSCDIEGDGGAGTIRTYHFGPGMLAIMEGGKLRERIDEIDEDNHVLKYTLVDGDPRYKSMKGTMKYVPSETGTTTTAVFKAEFEIAESEEGEPDEITEMISLIQKSLERYLLANPAYA